ncbi:MAG: NUDIX hydrolase, partial [Bifidobacteriaceae bacterium]|nr:NUDIX hydrolase [Bifidobacteriaceae bacterium]
MSRPADGQQEPKDTWFDCACGHRHWGAYGAAGLLVMQSGRVLLQLRSRESHHPNTWALPGGARHQGEAPLATALRESREETGLNASNVTPRWWLIADHRGWTYTTIGAEAHGEALDGPSNWETDALSWVVPDEVPHYDLHPGLAAAWPRLSKLIGQRFALVVDAANVVGSSPDGWWKDRAGAAARLRDRLEPLGLHGLANLDGDTPNGWFPQVVLVVEGQARGIDQPGTVEVIDSPGEGDDQ